MEKNFDQFSSSEEQKLVLEETSKESSTEEKSAEQTTPKQLKRARSDDELTEAGKSPKKKVLTDPPSQCASIESTSFFLPHTNEASSSNTSLQSSETKENVSELEEKEETPIQKVETDNIPKNIHAERNSSEDDNPKEDPTLKSDIIETGQSSSKTQKNQTFVAEVSQQETNTKLVSKSRKSPKSPKSPSLAQIFRDRAQAKRLLAKKQSLFTKIDGSEEKDKVDPVELLKKSPTKGILRSPAKKDKLASPVSKEKSEVKFDSGASSSKVECKPDIEFDSGASSSKDECKPDVEFDSGESSSKVECKSNIPEPDINSNSSQEMSPSPSKAKKSVQFGFEGDKQPEKQNLPEGFELITIDRVNNMLQQPEKQNLPEGFELITIDRVNNMLQRMECSPKKITSNETTQEFKESKEQQTESQAKAVMDVTVTSQGSLETLDSETINANSDLNMESEPSTSGIKVHETDSKFQEDKSSEAENLPRESVLQTRFTDNTENSEICEKSICSNSSVKLENIDEESVLEKIQTTLESTVPAEEDSASVSELSEQGLSEETSKCEENLVLQNTSPTEKSITEGNK